MTESPFAITISILSLGFSIYALIRDKRAVSASAEFLHSFADMANGIHILVTNVGRRPITIRELVLVTSEGEKVPLPRGEHKPVRLLESECYELVVDEKNLPERNWKQSTVRGAVVIDSHRKEYRVSGFVKAFNRYKNLLHK